MTLRLGGGETRAKFKAASRLICGSQTLHVVVSIAKVVCHAVLA